MTELETSLELELQSAAKTIAEERAKSRGLAAELELSLATILKLEDSLTQATGYGRHIHDHRLAETAIAYDDLRLLDLVFGSPGAYYNQRPLVEAIASATKVVESLESLQNAFEMVCNHRLARSEEEMLALFRGAPTENLEEWAKTRHAAIDAFVVKVTERVWPKSVTDD